MRYWSTPPLATLAQAKEKIADILRHYQTGDLFQFGIQLNDNRDLDQPLIGTCTLLHIHEQNRRAEIGYALGRPFWGHGYMH